MKQTILCIEDNEDNAEIIGKILEQADYTVYIAYDGIQGISLAEKHLPDVIICDFHLPNINGLEVISTLREKPNFKSTPVIMLTADIYTKEASSSAGVDKYLNKPIRKNQLLNAVRDLINTD